MIDAPSPLALVVDVRYTKPWLSLASFIALPSTLSMEEHSGRQSKAKQESKEAESLISI